MRGETSASDGLALLVKRGWGQEIVHQLMLREFFRSTDLGKELGLWAHAPRPDVLYEPLRGRFDLALSRQGRTEVLIELKVASTVPDDQRRRQQETASASGAARVYILLGTSFFETPREPDARYIGTPELATAIGRVSDSTGGAVGALVRAYLARLVADAAQWSAPHDRHAVGGLDLLRLYREIGEAWPVDVRPYHATNPGGIDWILNAQAWTSVDVRGWQSARFYWELVGARTRFKLEWPGDPAMRGAAREAYRVALWSAADHLGIPVAPTRSKLGRYMTALEFPGDVREEVLSAGRVIPADSRALYERATRLLSAGLKRLGPLG